jgi:hypothetical protein
MAVLLEAISVIIRIDALHKLYPGGWEAFRNAAPNQTLCADSKLARIGFMSPVDVESFVKGLEKCGLIYMDSGVCKDIVVADQQQGFSIPCDWAQCGSVSIEGNDIKACQSVDDDLSQLMTPDGWQFEGSLSQTHAFAPTEHVDKSLKFLRHEDGIDIYLNTLTGKEAYLGRTSET